MTNHLSISEKFIRIPSTYGIASAKVIDKNLSILVNIVLTFGVMSLRHVNFIVM